MLFNRVHAERIEQSARAAEFGALQGEFVRAFESRRDAAAALAAAPDAAAAEATFRDANNALIEVRKRAAALVREVTGDEAYGGTLGDTPRADVNHVFPTFVTTELPPGMVGLIIAAIFAAAMSTIAAELNSLATSTVIDIYRRLLKPVASEAHYLTVSKIATAGWGFIACFVAMFAAGLGSLIEVVNRFGSFFYGSLLGVFVLALGFKRVSGTAAFIGLIVGMIAVTIFAFHPATRGVSFLWHNPLGVVVVVAVGLIVNAAGGGERTT
jgi:solute:Na+ symporter, SSS family